LHFSRWKFIAPPSTKKSYQRGGGRRAANRGRLDQQEMTYPVRRRIIDLRGSLKYAHATGIQAGADVANETIDGLLDQIRDERQAMREEMQRLRRQFAIDLEAVAHELREARLEMRRLELIHKFSAVERDLLQRLH
jgi:hypothetical protein